MRKFPIGIQSFVSMRDDGYIYIDKTPFVKQLHDDGKYYFLSRPRRFGKSLFLDTLHQAFVGRKELFKGLFLYDNWDWDTQHPVIHISFGGGVIKNTQELEMMEKEFIRVHCLKYAIELKAESIQAKFQELIILLREKFSERVVVLVDEYDKPILDNITNIEVANELREALKNFYSVLKDCDESLELVFLTGVSKFSKVSIFSGLNNLKDLTINRQYSTICGYTQTELEAAFVTELVDVDMAKLKKWYNGYSWGNGSVYNPFDILQFLESKEYKNYWFESGTPSFLIKKIMEKQYFIPALENLPTSETIIGSFDIESIEIETLLFQSGYLTIKEVQQLGAVRSYILTYPNLEVKMSLNDYLLTQISKRAFEKEETRNNLYLAIMNNQLDKLQAIFQAFFAGIPHDWYRKNNIAEYEGFYASVFYAYFCALGLDVKAEDTTNHGRIDMRVIFANRCYIFEFKLAGTNGTPGSAMQQIKEKQYAEKYRTEFAEIYLLGVEFDKTSRNITAFDWEQYQ